MFGIMFLGAETPQTRTHCCHDRVSPSVKWEVGWTNTYSTYGLGSGPVMATEPGFMIDVPLLPNHTLSVTFVSTS